MLEFPVTSLYEERRNEYVGLYQMLRAPQIQFEILSV
jgi:hypothetical protein